MKKISNLLISLPSSVRRVALILADIFLINCSLILTLWSITNNRNDFFNELNYPLALITTLFGIFIFILGGQYKGLIRYFSSSSLYKLSIRNIIFLILLILTNYSYGSEIINIKFWFIFIFILTFLTSIFRVFIRDILKYLNFLDSNNAKKIIIYGAGSAGALLYSSIKQIKTTESYLSLMIVRNYGIEP